jgi:hypothetical protein
MMISGKPSREQLSYIFHLIINQRRLTYNTFFAIGYYLRCFVCRKTNNLKQIKSARTDFYLNKGIDKLNRDLDIVSLLDMIKGYQNMK